MSLIPYKSILVIDDDDVFRKRLARAVRDRNIKVFEAANGTDACLTLKEFQPEAAVLDLKIKQESGLNILKELLKINQNLKVVVLTGYGTITTAVEALKSGAVNYLTKPIDTDSILAAFNNTPSTNKQFDEVPNLEQVEWDHINRVIADHDGNISQASKSLGIHRRSLQRKLSRTPLKLK